MCPYEIAWVDFPDSDGRVHKYLECSGRGICDRTTAECQCFEGYEGKGCQRTACPKDCSGHGVCKDLEDLAYGSVVAPYNSEITTDMNTFSLYSWDRAKTRGCVCDPHWTEVDCSRRMCPKGNDIMDHRDDTEDTFLYQVQTVTIMTRATPVDSNFALTFKSTINETFTTVPIPIVTSGTTTAGYIEAALESLPNYVIDDVTVSATVTTSGSFGLVFLVTFIGDVVEGPQNLLIVEGYGCDAGCTPKLEDDGLDLNVWGDTSDISQTTAADFNNYECGRRGKCDYDSGLCECFEGYTGLSCNTQTALV